MEPVDQVSRQGRKKKYSHCRELPPHMPATVVPTLQCSYPTAGLVVCPHAACHVPSTKLVLDCLLEEGGGACLPGHQQAGDEEELTLQGAVPIQMITWEKHLVSFNIYNNYFDRICVRFPKISTSGNMLHVLEEQHQASHPGVQPLQQQQVYLVSVFKNNLRRVF